jgi:chromate transport protein ChrA
MSSYLWINYFYQKSWAWMIAGIISIYFLFYVFHSLIIIFGGAFLGLYLFYLYGPKRNKNEIKHKNEIKWKETFENHNKDIIGTMFFQNSRL